MKIKDRYVKYFLFLLLMASLQCFAQDYSAQLVTHRQTYAEEFLKDKHSPLKKSELELLCFYDTDSTYRVTAKAEIYTQRPPYNPNGI